MSEPYTVIVAEDLSELIDIVNARMSGGWRPHGSLTLRDWKTHDDSGVTYYQPMVWHDVAADIDSDLMD